MNNQLTKALITLAAFAVLGCGSDDNNYYGGTPAGPTNNGQAVNGPTGTLLFQPTNIQARALTSNEQQSLSSVTSVKFVGLGDAGPVYGPVRVAGTTGPVRLTDVPTSIRRLVVIFSNGDRVVGASVVPVSLSAGGETPIQNLTVGFRAGAGGSGDVKPAPSTSPITVGAFGTASKNTIQSGYGLGPIPFRLPLESAQETVPDITIGTERNGPAAVFSVPTAGDYLISYTVNTTSPTSIATGVVGREGGYLEGTREANFTPGSPDQSSFSFNGVVSVGANERLSLGASVPSSPPLGGNLIQFDRAILTITQVSP
ncbi:MAG: hypothetical protein J0I12_06100 [Candidatus Eremiobacteraeota bacterium]|nr:hypothetical protein [Candidatus Eremiobacteraeota bacterium]